MTSNARKSRLNGGAVTQKPGFRFFYGQAIEDQERRASGYAGFGGQARLSGHCFELLLARRAFAVGIEQHDDPQVGYVGARRIRWA